MDQEDFERLQASVAGRVQGVGYRYFVRRCAHRLDLTGWVMNEPDRSVTVVAEGSPEALEQLVDALKEGPPGSRVDRVTASRSPATGSFAEFDVRF
jgi:acylphosphatase